MTSVGLSVSNIDESNVITTVADDLHIAGTITFKSSLMINGSLDGEIVSEGLLIVGPTAKVKAKITTKNLVSHGEIQGDVTASEQVVLKKTAVQMGNITTPDIIVESGSIFNGSCMMERQVVAESLQNEAGKEGNGLGTEAQEPHDSGLELQEEAAPISKEHSGLPAEEAIPITEKVISLKGEPEKHAEKGDEEAERRMRAERTQRPPKEPKKVS